MKCPNCGGLDLAVIDVRPTDEGRATRRRRECVACKRRVTTIEREEVASVVVPVPVLHRCRNCNRFTEKTRCAPCAEEHRLKNNARGAELRAACGILPNTCSVCGGERHNARTCQKALKKGRAA